MSKAKNNRGPWNYYDGHKVANEGKTIESTSVTYRNSTRTEVLSVAAQVFFKNRRCEIFFAGEHKINRKDEDAKAAYKTYLYNL